MEDPVSKRRSLRVPVNFLVRCDLAGTTVMSKALNLSANGVLVKTLDGVVFRSRLGLMFLLPDTQNSVRVIGDPVWCRLSCRDHDEYSFISTMGIRFINLPEHHCSYLQNYALKMLYDEHLIRVQGILRIMSDIRNLPPTERLKAYHILMDQVAAPLKDRVGRQLKF